MTLRPAGGALHSGADVFVVFVGFEPAVGVRISSHANELFCCERKVCMNRLWQMTDLLCNLPPTPLLLAAPADCNRTGFRLTKTGNDIEQCALSGTVDSEQRHELSCFGTKAYGIEHCAAPIREAHIFDFKQTVQSEPPIPCTKSKSRCAAIGVLGPGTT